MCLSCSELFDVMRDDFFLFPAYLPQIPCGLTCSDRFGKLAYQFAFALGIVFGLKINHLEEFVKP